MDMAEKTPLSKWLDKKYLEWQIKEEESKNVTEFADYLGVNRSLLSYWMNGSREPSEDNLIKIAFKLGFEVYDILGQKRPNILHLYASRNWDKLPEKEQIRIAQIISKYSSEHLPGNDDETTDYPSPKSK
jgi:transcriptional regulator with XRE-family HTH domain